MLFEYTDQTLPIVAVSDESDGELQRIDVEMKVLAYWKDNNRIESGLGYWVQGSGRRGWVYTPTHLASGRVLCDEPCASEHMVRVFLEAIAPHADWNLVTQQEVIAAHGKKHLRDLMDFARGQALETIPLLEAEQIVQSAVRGLRNRTDIEELQDGLDLVGDLLASLRQREQKEHEVITDREKQDEKNHHLFERIGQYLDRTEERLLDQQREHLLMDAAMLLKAIEQFIPNGKPRAWYEQWLTQFEAAQIRYNESIAVRVDRNSEGSGV